MKKIVCIALSALLFTACHAEEKEGQITGTTPAETTATTPLTLTEIITTETSFVPEEPEEKQRIEIAVFDPFENSLKVEDEVYRELSEAVEKISDGRAFLYSNPTGFYADNNTKSKYYTAYADTDNVLEKSIELEYDFCQINSEIAETEEELFEYARSIVTENVHTDEEIRELLFAPESYDNQPCYKMIDDKLCIKLCYKGVMSSIDFSDITIVSYDENSVVVKAQAWGVSYPNNIVTMTLIKSEKYGWQMDSIDYESYWETEATLLYNGLKLREEQINKIFGGGTTPDNPRTTVIDGVEFTETDVGMGLVEMQDFFREAFAEKVIEVDLYTNETVTKKPLRDEYIRKYIDEVYAEIDGVLYRRNDAPKWYLPELKIDVTENFYKQTFVDKDGEITASVVIEDDCGVDEEMGDIVYYALKIASELPIKPLE